MWDLSPCSVIAIVVTILAAITDARHGLIPNWLTFPVILGAPLVHAWSSGPGALLRSLGSLLLCALVPYLLFRRGGMGGGDVKLFAALGALCGLAFGMQVQLAALLIACSWAFGVLAYRGELLLMLWRSSQLLLGRCLPSRLRVPIDATPSAHVRLGVPIAIATAASLLLEQTAWLQVLS